MQQKLPEGSKIKLNQSNVDQTIVIPQRSGGITKYFTGLFLIFWLGGWFFGFKSAATEVFSGRGGGFLTFWLAGWTIGGILVAYILLKIFRPSISESIILLPSSIKYDSGIPPFRIHFSYASLLKEWKSRFLKRTKIEINKEQINTLSLRETDSGNRLTIDVGVKRIDIGRSATEIEREWLFETLKDKYS